MELVPINGLYEVRFNGSAITNCFSDFDCPGRAQICAVNETWSYYSEGQCSCDATLGFGGFDCDEYGPLTYYLLVVMVITLAVVFVSLVEMTCIVNLLLRRPMDRKATALNISLGVAGLTSVLYFIAVALVINNALWFPSRFRSAAIDGRYPSRRTKTQEHGTVHVTLLMLSLIAVTLNMFFLSGVWTNVAIRVQKLLTRTQGRWLERISLAYLVFAVTVLLPTSVITTYWPVASGIVFAITLILSLSFALAAYKIGRVLKFSLTSIPSDGHSAPHTDPQINAQRKTTQALWRMHRTAVALSCLCLVAAITLGVWGIGPARRATYTPPVLHLSRAPREVCYRLIICTFALCNFVVVHYLMRTVQNKATTSGKAGTVSDAATPNELHRSNKKHHQEVKPEVQSDATRKGESGATSQDLVVVPANISNSS